MSFTVINCEQRSPEWYAARAGRLTGSCCADMLAEPLKAGGERANRRDLRTRLALERLTNRSLEDDYLNADMRRGIDLEPEGLLLYEAISGNIVQRTGFLAHDKLPIGCSLDGHVGEFTGVVEVKAPRSANHLKYLRAGVLPPEHKYQIVHNMLVTGASWADFCSFDPTFPEPLRLFCVHVERNETDIEAYRLLLTQFLREIDKEYAEIARMAMVAA